MVTHRLLRKQESRMLTDQAYPPPSSLHTKVPFCSRITSTTSPSFCMTTTSARLTNHTVLLPQSQVCSYYVTRRTLAPPPLWLQKHTDLRAHECGHCPDFWHQTRLANVTWSWRLCGINPDIHSYQASRNTLSRGRTPAIIIFVRSTPWQYGCGAFVNCFWSTEYDTMKTTIAVASVG
jgi:hypothetical protein